MSWQIIVLIIFTPIYLTIVYLCRKHRQWLFYYLFGAFGFTLLVTLTLKYFLIDQFLIAIEVFHTNIVANLFKIPSQTLAYGRLRLPMQNGWSILAIGVECSAVLEMAALSGLIIFYPAFSYFRKTIKTVFGLFATYAINIIRMLIILAITYYYGTDYVFIAHAIVGRLFFFICVIILYWFLITKPTVKSVGSFLQKGLEMKTTIVLKEPWKLALKSTLLMLLVPISLTLLTVWSFRENDQWRTAFQGKITPEREVSGQVFPEKPTEKKQKKPALLDPQEISCPETSLYLENAICPEPPEPEKEDAEFVPEVPAEQAEEPPLIPTLPIATIDENWICQIERPEELEEKEFYYLWQNKNNSQRIILGPTQNPRSEIRGIEGDDWQCFVSFSRENLNEIEQDIE